jgi:hypothetical protein
MFRNYIKQIAPAKTKRCNLRKDWVAKYEFLIPVNYEQGNISSLLMEVDA